MAWLAVAATSTGFGIWATHFIAMLAFSPGIPSAYNIALTVLSLIVAIVVTGGGFAIAITWNGRPAAWLGGIVVGGGIAAMHYIGMAAFEVQGHVTWDLATRGGVDRARLRLRRSRAPGRDCMATPSSGKRWARFC